MRIGESLRGPGKIPEARPVEGTDGHETKGRKMLQRRMKRSGRQLQFSELLRSQTKDRGAFDELHLWIMDNLSREKMSFKFLASRAGMNLRNFARIYEQKARCAPARAAEVFRVETARWLLEDSSSDVDQIARRCGFGGEERMRISFQPNSGVVPRDYRKRFSV